MACDPPALALSSIIPGINAKGSHELGLSGVLVSGKEGMS